MILRALALAALAALPAAAQDWFEYRDWRVSVSTADTGQDARTACLAFTGGDGQPMLRVAISDGDVLPPLAWPAVSLQESAPRHFPTVLKDGDVVTFAFDDGRTIPGVVSAGLDAEGIMVAEAWIDGADSQAALRAMRAGARVAIRRGAETVLDASLAGFTAAYRKIAEACGFPVAGVID